MAGVQQLLGQLKAFLRGLQRLRLARGIAQRPRPSQQLYLLLMRLLGDEDAVLNGCAGDQRCLAHGGDGGINEVAGRGGLIFHDATLKAALLVCCALLFRQSFEVFLIGQRGPQEVELQRGLLRQRRLQRAVRHGQAGGGLRRAIGGD